MNTAWSKGAKSVDEWISKNDRSPSGETFEDRLTLKFGNKDAAAFHRFKGFASAVITDQQLSDAVKESLAQSLEAGKSLAEWRKDVGNVFDKQGVTTLNSFQAELIYRTETSLAYGAGQFAKLQAVSGRFPYWQYSTAKDERVRDSHRALEGKIFSTADSQYYPPLGFRCRCTAIPISKLQAEKRGITKPHTVTPEMRGNLQNAEFIGDKVGNFSDYLQFRMKAMPEAYKALIVEKLAEVEATLTLSPIEKIQAAEAEIVVNDFETGIIFDTDGNELFRKIGINDRVYFGEEGVKIAKDNIVTHNHPIGKSFSDADFEFLQKINPKELRAVTLRFDHSITITDFGKKMPLETWKAEIKLAGDYAKKYVNERMSIYGDLLMQEVEIEISHLRALRLAERGYVTYKRTESTK